MDDINNKTAELMSAKSERYSDMSEKELKLRQFIIEVAVMEVPAIKWFVALQHIYDGGIPENATFGDAINHYIDKVDGFGEYAEDETIDGYNKAYGAFEEVFKKEIDPAFEEYINAGIPEEANETSDPEDGENLDM